MSGQPPRFSDAPDVTQMLAQWRGGDDNAREAVAKLVYPMLRAMSQKALAAGAGGKLTLNATELAHDVYLHLLQQDSQWQNRGHMLAIIAQALRRVVVHLIRRKQADKRDSGEMFDLDQVFDGAMVPTDDGQMQWLQLDEALTALAAPIARRSCPGRPQRSFRSRSRHRAAATWPGHW